MPRISPIIENIVNTIPNGVYLRATDQEANIAIDDIDLDGKILVLYNNLPTITGNKQQSGFDLQNWPVEIKILKLADMDDNDVDGDLLRDDCLKIAEYIVDKFPQDPAQSFDDYEIEFAENYKIYDKIMTGCMLNFDYPQSRQIYCDDLNP